MIVTKSQILMGGNNLTWECGMDHIYEQSEDIDSAVATCASYIANAVIDSRASAEITTLALLSVLGAITPHGNPLSSQIDGMASWYREQYEARRALH